jgi:hypothetical protein
MRKCEICGRRLITGRKYCYEHRGYRKENLNPKGTLFWFLSMLIAIISGKLFNSWGLFWIIIIIAIIYSVLNN